MTLKKNVRIKRELTPAEAKRLLELRAEAEQDRDAIIAEGRRVFAAKEQADAKLRNAFALLRAERMKQGLSLGDIATQTGISKSSLSRLENELDKNPTINTLERYAEALGKTLVVTFQ